MTSSHCLHFHGKMSILHERETEQGLCLHLGVVELFTQRPHTVKSQLAESSCKESFKFRWEVLRNVCNWNLQIAARTRSNGLARSAALTFANRAGKRK